MQSLLENAIVRLLKQRPFFGHLVLACHRRPARLDHPLGITLQGGTPVISWDAARFATLAPTAQEALLEHVIRHLLHLHMSRRKERNRRDWDLACDLAVNPAIVGLPQEAPQPEYFALPDGLAAEEYYARLVDPYDLGNLAGAGTGEAEADVGGGRGAGAGEVPIDDHRAWDAADATPLALAEELIRSLAREAFRQADGAVPADLQPLLASLLGPAPIPWRQVLRQFIATAGRTGHYSTWLRPHRRYEHQTPGRRPRRCLDLLVGVDVSESTDSQELREAFARELLRICRSRESRVTVLYANSRVQWVDNLRGSMVQVEVYRGGGFTDLRPVFDYALQRQPQPAALIYLTDGIGPVPAAMPLPTLWVLSRAGERPAPWGVELRLDA